MKRVFAFAMALLVMVGCLTGCGSNGNSSGSHEAAARDLFHIQTLLNLCNIVCFAPMGCDSSRFRGTHLV